MLKRGVWTALITPFYKGKVDKKSFLKLLKLQLNSNVSGLVLFGTTGESYNLSLKEKQDIFSWTKAEVSSSLPLILGTGSLSTAQTIEQTQWAEKQKAEAALVVTPYYNRPTQEGLFSTLQVCQSKNKTSYFTL